MRRVEVLGPLDAAFLHMDDENAALHIGSVSVFDGPVPEPSEFRKVIGDALVRLPRYRQLPARPIGVLPLYWHEDQEFDLQRHLHRARVPAPGRRAQLDKVAAKILSRRLQADRPLWECWIVRGLAGGRWALIGKVHHCMADGIAGTALLTTILQEAPGAQASRRRPGPTIPATGRVSSGVDAVVGPARGLISLMSLLRPVRSSSLTGDIGPRRSYASAAVPMRDLRLVGEAFGVTVNDVVLAAVTGAYRSLLINRGEEPDPAAVRTLIPVSVRPGTHAGRTDNEISAVVARLPVDVADPVQRLLAVRQETEALKRSGEAAAAELLLKAATLWPAPAMSAALQALSKVPQRVVSTVTTNVPGPPNPLQFAGRRLRAVYPYVPIADQLRTGVAVISYVDTLYIGVTGDWKTFPDVDRIASGIRSGVRELAHAAATARLAGVSRAAG